MVWLHRSPKPVEKRGIFYSFKLFRSAFTALRGRGGGGPHPLHRGDQLKNWEGGGGWCMTKTGVKHTRRRDPVHILSIRGMQRGRGG